MQNGFQSVFLDMFKYSVATFIIVVGLMAGTAIALSNDQQSSDDAKELNVKVSTQTIAKGYGV